ncbi:MAG: NrtR DNA-binding winged helix domain-containing protein [Oscillospiraceae bacterium]
MTEKEFLQNYDMSKYPRPSVAVDMAIFTVKDFQTENYRKLPQKKLNILMIKRGNYPFKDKWALAGGFVMKGESTEQSAKRELFEETGVENIYLEQLYTFSDSDRDPRGWIMSCSYMALVDFKKLNAHAGDDAKEVEWFSVDYDLTSQNETTIDGIKTIERYYTLTLQSDDNKIVLKSQLCNKLHVSVNGTWCEWIELSSDLAFDHSKIIAYAIERLRNKIEYTTIAFNLLPETFTYTDLQMVCETILGKKLLSANFRRKMKKYVIPADEINLKSAGHRPAKLMKRNFI